MRKSTVLFCILCSCAVINATAQTKPEWDKIFTKINQEVLDHSKAYSSLKYATETIGHRLTGSENGKKAEEYAYNLLKSYGFKDVRYQPFEVESWSRGMLQVSVGESNNLKPIKSVTLAHSPVKVDVSMELVDMGNGLEEDYLANPDKAKDKIALVYLGVLPAVLACPALVRRVPRALFILSCRTTALQRRERWHGDNERTTEDTGKQ